MAEVKQYIFSYKEIAQALVEKMDLHEGHWGIYMEFGIQGANVGRGEDEWIPAALIPVLKVGIQRFDKPNSLTVDASQVNPPRKAKKAAKG